MTQPQLLIAVLLMQQGLCTAMWLAAALLRLSRRASLHWALATSLVAGAMALILQRGQLSPWLTMALPNVMLAVGIAALRRGLQRFLASPVTDKESLGLIAMDAVATAVIVGTTADTRPAAVVGSLVMAVLLLRMAAELYAGIGANIGRTAARWCAAPVVLFAAVFIARAVIVAMSGSITDGSLSVHTANNLATAFLMVAFGLILNALLVTMTILRLVRRLQHQSDHDVLTDLFNRRAMERLVHDEAHRQRRAGGSYALLSVDIDHFKRINDHYGHSVGDQVLKRLATVMRETCRQTDRLARMGGEEFWVLMPGAEPADAQVLGERMLHHVRSLDLGDVATGLKVTISIGLANAESPDEPTELLLRRLDVALYAAKNGGRDRMVQAEPALY